MAWRTNTFSFNDILSLRRFLLCLSPLQARQIRTLHLHLKWNVFNLKDFYSNRAVVQLRKLQGLRSLWLCLKLCIKRKRDYPGKYHCINTIKLAKSILPEKLIKPPVFSILKALPKEKAEVYLRYEKVLVDTSGLPLAERLKQELLDGMGKEKALENTREKTYTSKVELSFNLSAQVGTT